jgi:hypothetical protein
MQVKEISFRDLSQISYRLLLYEFPKQEDAYRGDQVLSIEFSGKHGVGSDGNGDSLFMESIAKIAVQTWPVEALILDFRKLSYEWGNSIGRVLLAGKAIMGSRFPTAAVVSDLCKDALEGARPFYAVQPGSGEKTKWLFDDVESALIYIKEQIDLVNRNQPEKPRWRLFKRK